MTCVYKIYITRDTPEFKRLSNRNKGNKRSKEGAATYVGGSISISIRNKLKEQQTKEPVTIRSSFADNFVKKADREKPLEELPPGRVRDCLLSYDVLEAEQNQRLSEDPDYHVLSEDELWSTAAGGPNKKGEVLGMNHKRKKSLLTDDGGTSSREKYTTPTRYKACLLVNWEKMNKGCKRLSLHNLHNLPLCYTNPVEARARARAVVQVRERFQTPNIIIMKRKKRKRKRK